MKIKNVFKPPPSSPIRELFFSRFDVCVSPRRPRSKCLRHVANHGHPGIGIAVGWVGFNEGQEGFD